MRVRHPSYFVGSCMRALRRMTGRILILGLLALTAACTTPRAYLGEPIERLQSTEGYRASSVLAKRDADDLLLIVSFSGGGMRASAMAYGVLEQLSVDRIRRGAGESRMIDEIDMLSAVSGGAIPAAYFVLNGDRLFEDFSSRFLEKDVGAALRRRILWDPRNWFRLASSEFSRGDLYAEYFDRRLFRGTTFGDLDRSGRRPMLVIHATDVARASRFEFTQDSFDPLCIDLLRYPLSRAVAASSSIPALFTPITLRSHAGRCGAVASGSQFPYLHLVDGALSDNLGVRTMLDALSDGESPLQRALSERPPRKVVYVTMNAGDSQSAEVGSRRQAPAALQMLRLMGTVPVDRYSADSKMLLRGALQFWAQKTNAELYYVELELESMREDRRFGSLVQLPTSLALGAPAVGELRCAAGELLHRSADYLRLLEALDGHVSPTPACVMQQVGR